MTTRFFPITRVEASSAMYSSLHKVPEICRPICSREFLASSEELNWASSNDKNSLASICLSTSRYDSSFIPISSEEPRGFQTVLQKGSGSMASSLLRLQMSSSDRPFSNDINKDFSSNRNDCLGSQLLPTSSCCNVKWNICSLKDGIMKSCWITLLR